MTEEIKKKHELAQKYFNMLMGMNNNNNKQIDQLMPIIKQQDAEREIKVVSSSHRIK